MSQHEYIKYITSRIVEYMNENKTERKEKKEKEKNVKKYTISNQWFGLFPFSFKVMFKKTKRTS